MDTINNLYIVIDKNNKLCKIDLIECDTYVDYIPVFTPIETVELPSLSEMKNKESEFQNSLIDDVINHTSTSKYREVFENLVVRTNSGEVYFSGCEKGHVIKSSLHIFKPCSYNHYFYGYNLLNNETSFAYNNREINVSKLISLYAGNDLQLVEIHVLKCVMTKPFYEGLQNKHQALIENTGIALKNVVYNRQIREVHSRIDELESEIIVCLESSDTKIQEFVDKHSHLQTSHKSEHENAAPYYNLSTSYLLPEIRLSSIENKLTEMENKIKLFDDLLELTSKHFEKRLEEHKNSMRICVFEQNIEIQALREDYNDINNSLYNAEEENDETEDIPEIYNINCPLFYGLFAFGFFVTIASGGL